MILNYFKIIFVWSRYLFENAVTLTHCTRPQQKKKKKIDRQKNARQNFNMELYFNPLSVKQLSEKSDYGVLL